MVKSFVDVNGNEEQKREEESVMYKIKLIYIRAMGQENARTLAIENFNHRHVQIKIDSKIILRLTLTYSYKDFLDKIRRNSIMKDFCNKIVRD